MSEPKLGDKDLCLSCSLPIIYIGPYWRHDGDLQPRHPAQPGGKLAISSEDELARLRAENERLVAVVGAFVVMREWEVRLFKTGISEKESEIAYDQLTKAEDHAWGLIDALLAEREGADDAG